MHEFEKQEFASSDAKGQENIVPDTIEISFEEMVTKPLQTAQQAIKEKLQQINAAAKKRNLEEQEYQKAIDNINTLQQEQILLMAEKNKLMRVGLLITLGREIELLKDSIPKSGKLTAIQKSAYQTEALPLFDTLYTELSKISADVTNDKDNLSHGNFVYIANYAIDQARKTNANPLRSAQEIIDATRRLDRQLSIKPPVNYWLQFLCVFAGCLLGDIAGVFIFGAVGIIVTSPLPAVGAAIFGTAGLLIGATAGGFLGAYFYHKVFYEQAQREHRHLHAKEIKGFEAYKAVDNFNSSFFKFCEKNNPSPSIFQWLSEYFDINTMAKRQERDIKANISPTT
jgi:hypothetical protein